MRLHRRYVFMARLFFFAAFLLICACIGGILDSDGVLVLNLNVDFGEVRPGQKLNQTAHIINYTLRPVSILSVPTCGCTIVDNWDHTLRPLGTLDIPIEYDVGAKQRGRVKRDFVILYRIGKRIRRTDGIARFTVRP